MGAGLAAAGVAIAVLVFNVSITKSSTATKQPSITTTSTTQPATTTTVNPGRPPAQVHLVVLNGSGAVGAAGSKAYMLGALGYQIVSIANTTGRQGTVVECKPGFELEAATLAKNVGAGATVTPFPAAPPTGSANADCVVVLGQ